MPTEAQIEAHLLRRVRELGGKTAKMTVRGQRGWPDRLVILPHGRISLVELKKPKGGVYSPAQLAVFGQLGDLGVYVWRLHTYEDIDRVFGPPNQGDSA
jgi:hypothetical protein